MSTQCKPLFALGEIVATPGALDALARNNSTGLGLLRRHIFGDWGMVNDEDKQANDRALETGARLLSAYRLEDDTTVWIITEAADDTGRRAATTFLLPEEY